MSNWFMLDTDSASFAIRGQGRVAERMLQHRPSELCISVIALAELRYGADLLGSRKIHDSIDRFISNLKILPLEESSTRRYGAIASQLQKQGTPIGDWDVLIAAHALAVDATLVTNNVKHFARIRGLRVENWL
jgi:tRNA(fMet)-specific endonuclease VapC